MFKRTIRLLQETNATKLAEKHKKILEYYTPNDQMVEKILPPYELRGEYLPRKKINPFKKAPLMLKYDRNNFSQFVLPSKRAEVFSMWGLEELFGIKRWRNDSPFIKEYIRVDNQIFVIFILLIVLTWPIVKYRVTVLNQGYDTFLTTNMGKYTAEDLK
jgi:hypothetical protein